MKKMMIAMVVLVMTGTTHAAYTYTYGPGTDFGAKTLFNSDSMLVNGGGA
jgi:hypothetical protein